MTEASIKAKLSDEMREWAEEQAIDMGLGTSTMLEFWAQKVEAIEDSERKAKGSLAEVLLQLRDVRRLLGYIPFWARMVGSDEGGHQMIELDEAKRIIDQILEAAGGEKA